MEHEKLHTDRRTLIPEKIGDAGGNAYTTVSLKRQPESIELCWHLQDKQQC